MKAIYLSCANRAHLLFLLLAVSLSLGAQPEALADIAFRYIDQHRDQWQLTRSDIADMVVSNQYGSKHNGATHVYFIQRYAGTGIHNAIAGVHLAEDGEVAFATNRFVPNIAGKVNATEPQLTAYDAIVRAGLHIGTPVRQPLRLLENPNSRFFRYDGEGVSLTDIPVRLVYQYLRETDQLRLAWDVTIDQIDASDYWSLRVDALTGEVLERNNLTLYCNFHADAGHRHSDDCTDDRLQLRNTPPAPPSFFNDGATYNVWPVPLESPIHGEREMVVDPADPAASPFGWHDTNGTEGPEYRITRGNNVHAYQDSEAQNGSSNDEPNGGDDLVFDFPFFPDLEPDTSLPLAVTQLFYMNNVLHDFTYAYGFTEEAGNFQTNTYGNGGVGQDYVLAEAQDGAGTNNANFSSPADGANGRMQMFLWDQAGGELLTVLEPESIAGGYQTGTANYGPPITDVPVEGKVVAAFDDSNNPALACQPIVNAGEVAGNVALIDRGSCFFEEKTANAESAGAVAVIICNYENNTINMAGVEDVSEPGIPTVMLSSSDCNLIKDLLATQTEVTIKLQLPESIGTQFVDGTLDNGIVAHEYGHGISIRLTGGGGQSGCLFNDEQMGEGWSDFFTLVTSVRPGDTGELPRGIGNYAIRAGINGGGIRRFPYSTNPEINNQEYDDVIATGAPHPLGEVWASVLWDLYWRLVDEYGWDEDLYYGDGGNNIAIQLVMDGMKLQACNPGFIDGRDAIIAADFLNYDGAHECLIWEVFANRGFGLSADQNSPFNRNDNLQDFTILPECVKELKITKSVTPLIEAGEEIEVTLTVTNHKTEAATGVVVTDEVPAGSEVILGSVTGSSSVSVDGNIVTMELADIASGQSRTITYQLSTAGDLASVRQFFDDMEEGDGNWVFLPLTGLDVWNLGFTSQAYSGFNAWNAPSTPNENDQVLQTLAPILVSGAQPVLRFFHRYDTDPVLDGGIVQVSDDGGNTWEDVPDAMFKNGYRGRLDYQTFTVPNIRGFWGNSQGYVDTYVDLSNYLGEEVYFRFRFGTQPQEEGEVLGGWYIDNVEVMDLFNYNGEACVSSVEGDLACASAPSRGTIVEPGLSTSTEETALADHRVRVFPNPAGNLLNVSLDTEQAGTVHLEVMSTDGRSLLQSSTGVGTGYQVLPLDVSALPAGLYLVRVRTPEGFAVEKVTIR